MADHKFLVPILLPADPTAALQAVTKQYVDARVVATPAQAGPRGDNTAQARFGHTSQGGDVGWMANSDGSLDVIVRYGTAGGFQVYERNQAQTGWTNLLQVVAGFFRVKPGGTELFGVDTTRAHFYANAPRSHGSMAGYEAEYRNDAARQVVLYGNNGQLNLYDTSFGDRLSLGADGYYHISGGTHYFQISSVNLFTIGPVQLNAYKQFCVRAGTLGDGTYGWAPLITLGGSDGQRLALNSPSIAPQLRSVTAAGDALECVNSTGGAYSNFRGSAFNVVSSVEFKHDIETFGKEREQITVQDWESDVVPRDLSIMDLRPIVFRHNEPAYEALEDGKIIPKDGSTIIGRQRLREHLGLAAEQVATVIPSAVDYMDDGTKPAIDYAQITVALLEHVQRLTDEVATLRYRISELEKGPEE